MAKYAYIYKKVRTGLCEFKTKSVKSIYFLGISVTSYDLLVLATTNTTRMRCGNLGEIKIDLPSIMQDMSLIAVRLLHI